MGHIHKAWVILFVSYRWVIFAFIWVGLIELHVFDVFDIVSQGVYNTGIDAVLEAKSFCQKEGVVIGVYFDGSWSFGIKLNDHFDSLFGVDAFW